VPRTVLMDLDPDPGGPKTWGTDPADPDPQHRFRFIRPTESVPYFLETFPYGKGYFLTNKSNKNLVGSRLRFATVFVSAKIDTRHVKKY
jgi:hypothetical protein